MNAKECICNMIQLRNLNLPINALWTLNSILQVKSTQILLSTYVAQMVKHLSTMRETRVQALGWEDPLEMEMAIHSSTIAWKIPWTEEPGKLQSMGSQRVGHGGATSFSLSLSFTHTYMLCVCVYVYSSIYSKKYMTWFLILAGLESHYPNPYVLRVTFEGNAIHCQ